MFICFLRKRIIYIKAWTNFHKRTQRYIYRDREESFEKITVQPVYALSMKNKQLVYIGSMCIYIYRLQEAHRISAMQIVSKLKPVSCNNYYMYSLCVSVLSYQSYGSQKEIVHFFYILQRMCFTCMHFLIISLIMYVYITNFEAVR